MERRLIIFLPGLGDILEDYEFYGFIEAVRQSGVPADMLAADLHFGYYLRRTAIERLRNDIVLPARRNGYEELDILGISLGGLGALHYAIEHPGEIRRLFLLAPYVGDQRIIGEVAAAGGARRRQPGEVAEHDYQRKLWRWLRSYRSGANMPELYLGYGEQDKFASGNRLLGEVLAQNHVYTVAGSHNWPTWSRLWKILLSRR
jgi:pimeloyl-ACP methyl ester carboxylesterase